MLGKSYCIFDLGNDNCRDNIVFYNLEKANSLVFEIKENKHHCIYIVNNAIEENIWIHFAIVVN